MNGLLIKGEQRISITIVLGIGSLLCISLLIFRVYLASSFFYAFLIWNLFLAWIPIILSGAILKLDNRNVPSWAIGIVFVAWLLFFPNSPYILTDLFHFKQRQNIPLWYDLILIISFSWHGLILGFISLLEIQNFLNKKFTTSVSWFVVIAVLFLCGFGIYLGRFERWNSWDILASPVPLLNDITDRIFNPFSHPRTFGVTMIFSIFLIISYLTLFFLINSKKHEQ